MKKNWKLVLLGIAGFGALAFIHLCFGDAAAAADEMQGQLVAQERAGLDALKAGDVPAFGSSVGEEAVFLDDHGPATKAQVMKNVEGFRLIDYSISDPQVVRVSDAAGMLIYKLTEHGTSHGHEFTATVYISTLYVKRDGKWVSLFSQETAARPVTAKPAS
jgi:hypothetical protein